MNLEKYQFLLKDHKYVQTAYSQADFSLVVLSSDQTDAM